MEKKKRKFSKASLGGTKERLNGDRSKYPFDPEQWWATPLFHITELRIEMCLKQRESQLCDWTSSENEGRGG